MKKYLLGLFAVILAIGFSSYTHIARFNTTYFYQAPGGSFADADVTTLSNWTTSTISCTGLAQVACSISVPAANINQDGTLNSSLVTIVDQEFGTSGKYKVIAGTGYSSPVNKVAP